MLSCDSSCLFFKPLAIFYGCTALFVSDLVRNPKDRFSHEVAHLFADKSLPTDLSLSQLIQVLQQQGLPQGQSVLEFAVKVSSSKSKDATAGT